MLVVTTVFAITTALAAFSVGLVCGYYRAEESSGFKAQCDKLRSDAEVRAAELEHATAMLTAAQEENANLTKRVIALTRHYLDQTNRMRAAEQQRIDAEACVGELELQVSVLKERGRYLAAKVAEQNTFALDI